MLKSILANSPSGQPETAAVQDQREQLFRYLIDSALDIVTVLDDQGVIRFENRAIETLFGYTSEELIGSQVLDLIHPDDHEVVQAALARIFERPWEPQAAEFRYCTKDGDWRYLSSVGKKLAGLPGMPDVSGVIVNSRDVTSQVLAEKALRESEERFRELTDNIDEVFWIRDIDFGHRIYYVSPAFEKIWGRTCQSLLQDPRVFVESVHPDDRKTLVEQWHTASTNWRYEAQYRIVRPDGEIRWISDHSFPVYDDRGKVCRCAGVARDITAKCRREDELRKLMLAIEQSPAAIVITDKRGVIEFVNPKFSEVTGYSAEEVIGMNPRVLKSGTHDDAFYRELWETISAGRIWQGEFSNKKKNGELYWESASVSPVRNQSNEITHYLAVKEDITNKVHDREKLRLQSSALAAAANSIFITNEKGQVTWANAAFCRMSGYALEELLGQTPRIMKSGEHPPSFYKKLWNTILAGDVWSEEVVERRKDGSLYTVHQTITPLKDDHGKIRHFIAVQEDITARKQAESKIHQMAYHDVLTGLPNRIQLQQRLAEATSCARRKSTSVALHFIDLDRFKVINDTLGHSVGDELLVEVAGRLKGCLRAGDLAARLGGDEFAVIQTATDGPAEAAALARRIVEVMAPPFRLAGRDIHTSPSIGISMFPLDGHDEEQLIKNADLAMYSAKKEGRNNFQFFTDSLNSQIRDRLSIEADLHRAIRRHEFVLYYQPQVDIATGALIGMEALIRWQHPTRGLLLPSLFIGVAEECSLIHAISSWVLENACRQNVAWHRAGYPRHRVAVNVSSANFKHADFFGVISGALRRTGLPPRFLELEVTETLLLQDEQVRIATPKLKELGVALSIDDFGTGYSSLTYLRRLPVEKLKIDRSFVNGISDASDDAIIAKAIIDLGHALGHTVIAEGVETRKQLEHLRKLGCDEAQGYLFGRPMPAAEFEQLLERDATNDNLLALAT
ncbi:MAG: PAS domain S-box protein [Pirellulales bacterium]